LIPTVLIPAVLIGRWFLVPLLAFAWAMLIVIAGDDCGVSCFGVSAGIAAANAAVGVAVHKAVRTAVETVVTSAPRRRSG